VTERAVREEEEEEGVDFGRHLNIYESQRVSMKPSTFFFRPSVVVAVYPLFFGCSLSHSTSRVIKMWTH